MRNRKTDIEKYLRGELSSSEMHALEKEALNDPFLAEALEGVEQAGADNFLYDLHHIKRSVHDRARRRSEKNNRMIRLWGMTSAVAATVLLVAVAGYVVIDVLREQAAERRASRDLAMLQEIEGEEDTVYIPLPKEAIVTSAQIESRRDPLRLRRAPVASSIPPVTQGALAGELQENPVESKEETATDDEAAKEKLQLATQEAARQRERQEAEEAAGKLEIARADVPETKAAEKPAEVSTRDADKKQRRTAGAEAQSRTPSTQESFSRDYIQLRGTVVSAGDGKGLPGVNIVIKGTRNGTVTDAEGNYSLTVPADNAEVLFSFIGFSTQEVAVAGQTELNVQLQEDISALSEVVVTGYAREGIAEPDRTFSFAEPHGGRAGFRDYLSGAVKYPQQAIESKTEGKVTVRFTVEPNGTLTDFEVLRGIGSGCDEELIRAIKEGPSWAPSSQGSTPLRDKVKVRYKFELPR